MAFTIVQTFTMLLWCSPEALANDLAYVCPNSW
jgi:hypothetical protein